MARKFLKYDTKNCPSNVDEKGCLIGGGGGGSEIIDIISNTSTGEKTCDKSISEIMKLVREKNVTFRLFLGNDSTLSDVENGTYSCSVSHFYMYVNPSSIKIYFAREAGGDHFFSVVAISSNGIEMSTWDPAK